MKKILHIEGKKLVQVFEERLSFGASHAMADVQCHCGLIRRIIYTPVHKNGYSIMTLNATAQLNPAIKRKLPGSVFVDEMNGKSSPRQLRLF